MLQYYIFSYWINASLKTNDNVYPYVLRRTLLRDESIVLKSQIFS
jgi:hypothetical protein